MIEHVGFFHFVQSYEEPLCELTKCLEKQPSGRTGEALIVLPEGFNLGRAYNLDWQRQNETMKKKPMFAAHCMREFLHGIAKARSLVFVVGLIEDDQPKRNRAYLIDGKNSPWLMYNKMNNDYSGEYEPCKKDCHRNNPHKSGDVWIGALLCMDAERQTEGDDEVKKTANSKRDVLFLELDRQLQRRLLCVPAAFSGRRSWEGDKYLLGKGVVIANSTTACASTIINQKGELVKSSEANTNEIVIVEMDHVTTPSA